MNLHKPTESEVRALRDQVYGRATTDRNWDGCREHWMKPENVAWLQEHACGISRETQPRVCGQGKDF